MWPSALVEGSVRKASGAFNIVVQMPSQTGCVFYGDKKALQAHIFCVMARHRGILLPLPGASVTYPLIAL